MWEQLFATNSPLVCSKDIELFVKYRDRRKFMHFMIGLREDFEPTRASLLNRSPTPSLDVIVKELISEENCQPTHHMSSFDHVLVTPSPQPPIATFIAPPRINSGRPTFQSSKGTCCDFCRAKGHDISVGCKLQKFMQDQNKASLSRAAVVCPSDSSVPTGPSLAFSLTTADIETVVQQVLSHTSTALFVTSGKQPCFFDTACCNHMTPYESQFSNKAPLEHLITIYTVDGTPMPVSHKGTISFPCLSFSDTFHIPKLSLNLLFVGQLCELGIDLLFTNHGVDVQDPRTGQVLRTGCKVGHMFEVHDLKNPSQVVSAVATIVTPSPNLWHARLGYPYLSHLQLLASQGHLGLVQFQNFDYTSYHFGKQTKFPFNNSGSFSSAPFDLIHSNIWGPAPIPTERGFKYFVIFVNDFA